jgi:hypothetical protein
VTVQGKVDGGDAAIQAIRKVPKRVLLEAKRIFARHVVLLKTYVRKEYLTGGTTRDKLAVRTGNLRASTRELPVVEKGDSVESGLGFGTGYAKTHIGPAGQISTIRPKKGKFLAIPLDAALTPSGVAKGSPRSGIWGDTFVFRLRDGSGRLMLFGKKIVQKGAKAGQARGNIVPLFLLVKQVRVPTRVHPEEILKWSRTHLTDDFKQIGIKLRDANA